MGKLASLLPILLMAACSHGQCSNTPQKPVENAATVNEDGTPSVTAAPPPAAPKTSPPGSVQVYKASGDKQCGTGQATPIEKMKDILTKNKVTVLEAHTQNDGMMHAQLCGSPSGEIHVFSISKSQVKKAKALGFKQL